MLWSSSSLLLFLLLPLLPRGSTAEDTGGGAGADARCVFRTAKEDFVLDTEDAVKEGAELLATEKVSAMEDCERACCAAPRCNLALLEPHAAANGGSSCVLFNCIHRNRFVCRFVNQAGYRNSILDSVFRAHLQGPQAAGDQAPPIANAGRDLVVQPGTTVTLSGVESLALGHAHITDYTWTLLSEASGVNMEQTNLPDQLRLLNLQPGTYRLQLTVTDSNGQSHASTVSVTALGLAQAAMYCAASPKVGPCRAAFPRWHYDVAAGECRRFVFGGCKPNFNNFLSKNECTTACSGVKVAPSERSTPTGEVCGSACGADQLSCSSGCCVHRSLECDGVTQCSDGSDEDHCSQLNRTLSRLLRVDVNQTAARCTEPPRTGPCRASMSRWYYDPLERKCQRFTFGGCQPNENNFLLEEHCIAACSGVTERHVFAKGIFERFDDPDETDSGSVALAVVLAVAILALLAILTYCFLKARKGRSHRTVVSGPAHVALSEQDTLVYNSTTKPV